jgi:DNA-binding MurR/RpiR family transcriptional regulator
MQDGQLRGMQAGDALIAVSFAPYAEETESVARQARAKQARMIAITDSSLSPLARLADSALLVQETSVFGFRALTNTMAVAQSLFLALAYRLELDYQPTRASAV